MTLEEKVGQLNLAAEPDAESHGAELVAGHIGAAIYSHGPEAQTRTRDPQLSETIRACQLLAREQTRLGVPLLVGSDVVHGLWTTFPIPFGLAATWDLDLVRACAARSALEAEAEGLNVTFAPMVDLSSEHRWGRIGETYGDEPQLAGRMGGASIRGFQAGGGLAATAKHFCGYGRVQAERDHETLSVGLNALYNTELKPFRVAVDAGCRLIMVGFHDVDGWPMHSHRPLIRDLLKGDWGFTGVVVSDWDGILQLVAQGVAEDPADAAKQALLAGVDLDMASGTYRRHLPALVDTGEVPAELVDDAVRRVLRLKIELGLLDPRRPGSLPSGSPLPSAAADPPTRDRDTTLARRSVAASMVLLKNAGGVLPLHSNLGLIQLCGPFVDDVQALLGTWVFDPSERSASPATALAERLGAENLLLADGRFSDVVIRQADAADVTVAMVGEHPSRCGEDRCLASADLPVGQLELLRELAALGKPLVVVVVTGRPLELRPVLALADALLLAWHPGGESGPALADVLLGVREPGGRLPMHLPRTAVHGATGTLERTAGRRPGRARDTRFGRYLNALVYPELTLGFGLGYTTFAYSAVELSRDVLTPRGVVRASVELANTGSRPGREVVQLYLRDLVATVVRPLVELADWQLVDLDPGESRRVTFKITPDMFAYHGRDLERRIDSGEVDLIIGPNAAHGGSARLVVSR
jgi:beta-glucosidase